MPHIWIEYSDDLTPPADLDDVLVELHDVTSRVTAAPLANIKSRVSAVDAHVWDDTGRRQSMVHADVALMEGRTTEAKAELAHLIMGLLAGAFEPASADRELQVTAEVRDIERATYAKQPEGTIA